MVVVKAVLDALLVVVYQNHSFESARFFQVPGKELVVFVEALHHVGVSGEGKTKVMSVSQVSCGFMSIMNLFVILVKNDNTSSQLSAIIEFSKLLEIIIHEKVCSLPKLFLSFHEKLALRISVNIFEWMENLIDPVENFNFMMS